MKTKDLLKELERLKGKAELQYQRGVYEYAIDMVNVMDEKDVDLNTDFLRNAKTVANFCSGGCALINTYDIIRRLFDGNVYKTMVKNYQIDDGYTERRVWGEQRNAVSLALLAIRDVIVSHNKYKRK